VLRPLAKASRLRLRARSTPETLLRAHGLHANRRIQAQCISAAASAIPLYKQ
jgi:hypothetical protein